MSAVVDDELVSTDLHGHSLFSDGRATPEEFVSFRARRRLSFIALSDHDTFAGVPRALAEARQHPGLTLVPAMEATSFIHFGSERAEQIHVLAYFPPAFLADGRLWQTALH
ncbi:MAG TPA: PHP domain-containing protein, partial [Myxococcota bacterium]